MNQDAGFDAALLGQCPQCRFERRRIERVQACEAVAPGGQMRAEIRRRQVFGGGSLIPSEIL